MGAAAITPPRWDLDSTFDGDGQYSLARHHVATDIGILDEPVGKVGLGGGGRTLVGTLLQVDASGAPDNRVLVRRIAADGSGMDGSFGTAGVTTIRPASLVDAGEPGTCDLLSPRIVPGLAGSTFVVMALWCRGIPGTTGVAKLTASGALDTSFGGGDGVMRVRKTTATQSTELNDFALTDAAVDSAGRLVLVSPARFEGQAIINVVRLTAAGAVDSTFGSDSVVAVRAPDTNEADVYSTVLGKTARIAVGPGDSVFVGGQFFEMDPATHRGSPADYLYAVLKLRPSDGAIDPGFGSGGAYVRQVVWEGVAGVGASDFRRGVFEVDGGGRLTYSVGGAVYRLSAAGAADTSFGAGGVVKGVLAPGFAQGFRDFVRGGDGKLYYQGIAERLDTPGFGFGDRSFIVRLTAAGAIDTSWGGGNGVVTVPHDVPGDLTTDETVLATHGLQDFAVDSSGRLTATVVGSSRALRPGDPFAPYDVELSSARLLPNGGTGPAKPSVSVTVPTNTVAVGQAQPVTVTVGGSAEFSDCRFFPWPRTGHPAWGPCASGVFTFTATEVGNGTYVARVSNGEDFATASVGWSVVTSVPRMPTAVALAPARSTVTYGDSLTLTARVLTQSSMIPTGTVRLYEQPYGAARTLVSTASLTSTGVSSFSVKPLRRTTYVAEYEGNDTYSPSTSAERTISVRSRTTIRLSGGYGTSGIYRLYRLGTKATSLGTVDPNHAGQSLKLVVQRYATGSWRAVTNRTHTIASSGSAKGSFSSTSRGQYRARWAFAGDADHLGSSSAWKYFRFTS